MNLIEEYLRAVALLLAKDKRDDIIDELRELILSRIEAREAELGRKLSDDETEAVLREIGHPLVVASRYRDGPQHVVGPAIYPYWMFAVKAAVMIQVLIAAMVFLVRAVTGDVARAFGQAVGSAFTGAVMLIGIATLAAWLLERKVVRLDYLDRWRVRDLRYLGFAVWDGGFWGDWFGSSAQWGWSKPPNGSRAQPAAPAWSLPSNGAARDQERLERRRLRREYRYARRRQAVISHGLGSLALAAVLLLWWTGVIRFGIASGPEDFRSVGIEPGALAAFNWAGLKAALYVPVLAYVALVTVQGVARIAHPAGVRLHGLFDLAVAALTFGTVVWLWSYSPLSSAIQVDTVAGFVRRMMDGFEGGPPFPLEALLTLTLVLVGFGAITRAIRGFFELVLPAPWFGYRPYPQPA